MNLNPAAIPAVFLTAGLFCLGLISERRVQSRIPRLTLLFLGIAASIPGFLLVTYYKHLFDNARWFYGFRTLRCSEISIGGLGWIAGFCYSRVDPEGLGEKLLWPVGLLVVVAVPFIKPVLDPIDLDRLQDRCPGGVCLQTTFSTCGPASAASLMLALGQSASEKELAHESLTSQGGTEVWYLARAFRQRGFQTHFVVQSAGHISPPSPSIAGVVLRGGQGHFIALLSENAGQITVVDPFRKGEFVATEADLLTQYRFTGLFLVVRPR